MRASGLDHAISVLSGGGSLTAEDCHDAMARLLDGEADDQTTAAFLTALHHKGETADELIGAVRAIRERMIAFDAGDFDGKCIDTCGSGGDGADTVNISTASAIVLAACGVRVAKHGNRAATSKSGSSDVLNRLGVKIDAPPERLRACLRELGIVFLFAPSFHPGLRGVAQVRRSLPFRTIFNFAGPLCNPARPAYQIVGVPRGDHAHRMALALASMPSIERAIVVTGADGLDEVSLDGPTTVRVVEAGSIREQSWTNEDFGLGRVVADELKVSSPEQSAEALKHLFQGRRGLIRDVVLANVAAALWTTSMTPLRDGVERAARAIDAGDASRILDRWSVLTQSES